jgi:hypothetical protein
LKTESELPPNSVLKKQKEEKVKNLFPREIHQNLHQRNHLDQRNLHQRNLPLDLKSLDQRNLDLNLAKNLNPEKARAARNHLANLLKNPANHLKNPANLHRNLPKNKRRQPKKPQRKRQQKKQQKKQQRKQLKQEKLESQKLLKNSQVHLLLVKNQH